MNWTFGFRFAMISKWLFIGLLLLVLIVPVRADSKGIEMYGGRWPNYTIGVKIPATPTWMRTAVIDAMETWNQAQVWFAQKYFPGGKTYNLVTSDTGQVAVRFQNLSSQPNLCTLGQETVPARSGTTITKGVMVLTGYCAEQPLDQNTVYNVAVHEFGHALGIGHVNFETPHDIMRAFFEFDWQMSTLDLYAVHVLATGSVPTLQILTLPNNIPYEFVPPSAIPEFPAPFIAFLVPLLLIVAFSRKRLTPSQSG